MELVERAQQLATQVIGPLVLGQAIAPVRPLGPDLGLQLGQVGRIADDPLRLRIDQHRTRRARQIVAIDVMGDLDGVEWAMAAALNDLLQVSNEELSSFATRSRHAELLQATRVLCERLPPPGNLYQAVARHATFGNLLGLSRTDTKVSWWTGSAVFRGQPVPARLQRWPKLRRVTVEKTSVPLAQMADFGPVEPSDYQRTLAMLLSASPLTDLAEAGRSQPTFYWSHHSLALVGTVPGRNLALRAFAHREPSLSVWTRTCAQAGAQAAAALNQATAVLPAGSAARSAAESYIACLGEAVSTWSATDDAA